MSDEIAVTLHLTAEHARILAHCIRLGKDEAARLYMRAQNAGLDGAAAIDRERLVAMQAMLEGILIQTEGDPIRPGSTDEIKYKLNQMGLWENERLGYVLLRSHPGFVQSWTRSPKLKRTNNKPIDYDEWSTEKYINSIASGELNVFGIGAQYLDEIRAAINYTEGELDE